MSGLAGLCRFDEGPVDRAAVERMTAALAPRGPDGSGLWCSGSAGLGHRQFRTTPESFAEAQPLTSDDGRVCLVADVRLDNRVELAAALAAAGRKLRTDTDPELMLQAYDTWEEACVEKFEGDFAVAIWDGRERRLVCARDRMGYKPLFYRRQGDTVAVASEPLAVYAAWAERPRPHWPLVGLYLMGEYGEPQETLFADVFRLPAAHVFVADRAGLRIRSYWEIDPHRTIRYRRDEDYAEHFKTLFEAVVRNRLRSRDPVGVLLSGGLDSSSVLGAAYRLQEEGKGPAPAVEAFSMVFETLPCDERAFIRPVLERCPVPWTSVTFDRSPPVWDVASAQRQTDYALIPSCFDLSRLLAAAKERGVRVMLDGDGGDDVFSPGCGHLTDLWLSGRIGRLWRQLGHVARLYGESRRTLLADYCLKPLLPPPLKRRILRRLKVWWGQGIPPWMNRSGLAALGVLDRLDRRPTGPVFPTRAQQEIYNGLRSGWAREALEMDERFFAHAGVERRSPFLDRHVLEFALAIPQGQRWNGAWIKTVLREAMRGILPETVRLRQDKADFLPVIDFVRKGRQSEPLSEVFRRSCLVDVGLCDGSQLREALARDEQDVTAPRLAGNDLELVLWLELWCRAQQSDRNEGSQ